MLCNLEFWIEFTVYALVNQINITMSMRQKTFVTKDHLSKIDKCYFISLQLSCLLENEWKFWNIPNFSRFSSLFPSKIYYFTCLTIFNEIEWNLEEIIIYVVTILHFLTFHYKKFLFVFVFSFSTIERMFYVGCCAIIPNRTTIIINIKLGYC